MANTFKNYKSSSVGTSGSTTYAVPSDTTSIMIGCNLANTSASQITVDVEVGGVFMVKGAPIPSGSSLSVLDGKVILEQFETVVVTSNVAASCDVLVSVLEQT